MRFVLAFSLLAGCVSGTTDMTAANAPGSGGLGPVADECGWPSNGPGFSYQSVTEGSNTFVKIGQAEWQAYVDWVNNDVNPWVICAVNIKSL